MGWIRFNAENKPKDLGEYFVLKFFHAQVGTSFFKGVPPMKKIFIMQYKESMLLESSDEDKCVYKKYKAFFDKTGEEQRNQDILYFYELDAIPGNELSE